MSARHSIAPPLLVVLLCLAAVAAVAEPVRVAFIQDGPIEQFEEVRDLLIDELFALTRGEFDVEIVTVGGGWTRQGIEQAFADAYADPGIDLVLGFGFATNQIMVSRERFPKPTFLPLVFDATLTNAPGDGVTSGKRNLSYLAERVTFEEELGTYLRIVDFQYAALLVDELILESIPEIRGTIRAAGAALGIRFHLIAHDGVDHDLLARLPGDIDAVIYTGLPRLPGAAFDTLVQGLIERRLPGFSLADQSAVLRGLLASETVETDWRRLARRNALNMQAVLLGEPASAQPVYFEGRQELTINLATARELGLSPRFDVLSEATLVNAEPPAQGPEFTLAEVGRLALEANLDLRAAAIDVETSRSDLRIARSALRPQLSLSGATTRRREAAPGTPALFPDRITDGALTLSQNIYSDDTYANLDISRSLADAAGAGFTAASLDTVRFAGLAFIDVLRARTLLDIRRQDLTLTKSNLDLARDRVRVGTATNADVFRWQSNLANARAAVLRARAGVDQSREALNRVLNRPLDAPFQVGAVAARDPFVVRTETFDELVNSPRTLYWLIDYLVDLALSRSPELDQLDALIDAKSREVVNRRRDFWLPDLALATEYADTFSQSPGSGDYDWVASLNLTLPLFSGGRRRAELARARLERRQIAIERDALAERIAQNIRAAMHRLYASYGSIGLSREAASAARSNLDLVTDAYARGAVNVIQLLDAQDQTLEAELGAENALYDFLADALEMQRAAARFDFLESAEEQVMIRRRLEEYLQERRAEADAR